MESNDSSLSATSSGATLNSWKYKHYFEIVEEGEKNIRARCKLCAGNKTLSCARNTTSNFKKHLDKVHKNVVLEARQVEGKSKRLRSDDDDNDNCDDRPAKKQCTLPSMLREASSMRLRNALLEYVIEDMQPLTTVESPAFRKLIGSVCSYQLPDRKSFTQHLDKLYDSMVKKVKEALEVIDGVSTTADVWTAHHRSYLGMTVHWIDKDTLKRCKAAIACVRITGRHTYDVIASRIEQIHANYGLNGKVVATITDNGSNFVKAFSVYSTDIDVAVAENDVEDEITFEDVDGLLQVDDGSTEDLTQVQYELPPHERCAAHTLNLVASTDVDKYLSSSSASRSVYRSSFAKSSALWNKASRSTVAADKVEEIVKRKLIVPTPTRWNSYYNAVVRITENSTAELNELCTEMELRCFNDKEITFLKEYCDVLKPLARGLDILQGEDNCYFGTLLPTLETIIKKVKAVNTKLSSMTTGLVDCIENAIKRRFQTLFESIDPIMAAVVLPKFKLKWVESQVKKDEYRQLLLQEMEEVADDEVMVAPESQATSSCSKKDDFYDFKDDEGSSQSSCIEVEANDYLRNAKSIECLHQYPTIKKLFRMYNTVLPSSAPVERLFSLGGAVLTPRRNRLTDARFEKLLLMRYNKDFLDI